MAELKLIGAKTSLFCTRVEWALKLKALNDYDYLEQDLVNKSSLLLQHNPVHKKVPVLIHGDHSIAESLVILEYIDEAWPSSPSSSSSLLPNHPYLRSQARFWAKFSDEQCVFGAWEACWRPAGEEKEKAVGVAVERFQQLEKLIQGRRFFGGGGGEEEEETEERIGYLDLVMGWIPVWVGVMEEVGEMKLLDPEKFPCLCQWSREFVEIKEIKECLPPRESLVRYFTGSLGYMRSLNQSSGGEN